MAEMTNETVFQRCFSKTKQYGADWRHLGVLLKVKQYRLNDIEKENPTDVTACRMKMLNAWLKSNPSNPERELEAVLGDLRQMLFHAHGDNAKVVVLDHDIEERISDLKSDFADLVVLVFNWLKKRFSSAEEAAVWLNEFLKSIPDDPFLIKNSVPDYFTLTTQLQMNWTFTNPDTLQKLVQQTKDKSLIEKMSKYKEEKKHVCQSIPLKITKPIIFEDLNLKMPCLILHIHESITCFDDIEIFLKDVFGIYKRYLKIHKIEPGSIKVTLQFPASTEPHIRVCIELKRKAVKHFADMSIEYQEDKAEAQGSHPPSKPEGTVKVETTTDKSEKDHTKIQSHQERETSKFLSKNPKPMKEATSAAAPIYLKDKTEVQNSPKTKPKEFKPKEKPLAPIVSEKEETETQSQQYTSRRQPPHHSKQTQFYTQHRRNIGARVQVHRGPPPPRQTQQRKTAMRKPNKPSINH